MATFPDPALVAAFEQACRDVQVPATRIPAEESIKSFTRHPDAISIALALVQHTTLPAARFHAATALRTVALDSWDSLTPAQRYGASSLRYQLVNFSVSTLSLSTFERNALLRTAAVFARRAYLEEPADDRNRFFSLVCETAANPDPAAAHSAMAATELIEFLGSEFMITDASRSTSLMQRQVHIQARVQFAAPQGHLISLLKASLASLSVALTVPGHFPMNMPEFDARVLPALDTVLRVLATDLAKIQANPTADAPVDLYAEATSGEESLEAVVISAFAGEEWVEIIDQLPTILRLCLIITSYHNRVGSPDEEPRTIPKATQVLTAVSAVSQRSYRTEEDAGQILQTMVDGMNEQGWAKSQLGVMKLAYAEVWRRISCAHGIMTVAKLGRTYLEVFTKDTCQVLDAAALSLAALEPDEEDVFSDDVIDVLLETWANISLQADDGVKSTEHPLTPQIEEVVLHCRKLWIKSSLENEPGANLHIPDEEEDMGFEDRSFAEAHLASAAVLLRFVLNKMAPMLAESLRQLADFVFQWGSGQSKKTTLPLDIFQEDLYFLIQLTCAVLADDAKGEHPSVPLQFLSPVPINGQRKPPLNAKILLSALFDVAQQESDLLDARGVHSDEASPRIGAAILDALTRITRTYLVPVSLDESSTRTAFEVIGGIEIVTAGRAGSLKKALEGLSTRGFESDVAESAATLLCALSLGAPLYRDIRDSHIWHTLLQAGADDYQRLPATAIRLVGKCLTKVLGDVVADRLLLPAYKALQSIYDVREREADAPERAIATVNLLRGAAMCANVGPRTRSALLLAIRAPDGIAVTCAKSFGRSRPDVGRSLIALADDIVNSCLIHLSHDDARDLVRNAIAIIKLYCEVISRHVSETSRDELCNDVQEVICLLSSILVEGSEFDVGEACYVGLSALFPILTEDMLAIPSVCAMIFGLTTDLTIRHPEWLPRIPADMCEIILHLIDLQRQSVDLKLERRSLEAVASLARSRSRHPEPGPSSKPVDSALLKLLRMIFMDIASGDAYAGNIDASADALLALIHVRHEGPASAFEEIGQELLSQAENDPTLRTAIQELAHSAARAGGAFGFNRPDVFFSNSNRLAELQALKSFRESVMKFSDVARKCLLSVAIDSRTKFEPK